jgi:hypothetical protein
MGMKQTIEVLNQMVVDEIIASYAIGGAIAAFRYIEPASTDDLDILVSFDADAGLSGLVLLTPIISYLSKKGYTEFLREGLLIENWPVQFLPVATALDAEALMGAATIEIEINPDEGSVPTRVLTAEHLMATALNIGRPKDHIRLNQFIEAGVFNPSTLSSIIERHGLRAKWAGFCRRFGIDARLTLGRKA